MSRKKIPNEKETRTNLLGWAKKAGCVSEIETLFARYDNLLRGAKTKEEYAMIQIAGVNEFRKFFTSSPDGYLILDTADGRKII